MTTLKKVGLPDSIDLEAIENSRQPAAACLLCESMFTGRVGKNPIRHCKRCAKAICAVCSENRRQLSKKDTNAHRVCDWCDTEMDNYALQNVHINVLNVQNKLINQQSQEVENLDVQACTLEEEYQEDVAAKIDLLNLKKTGIVSIEAELEEMKAALARSNANIADFKEMIKQSNETLYAQKDEYEKLKSIQNSVKDKINEREMEIRERKVDDTLLTKFKVKKT